MKIQRNEKTFDSVFLFVNFGFVSFYTRSNKISKLKVAS